LTFNEQRYFVWDTASQSTKRQDNVRSLGGKALCLPWLRLWTIISHVFYEFVLWNFKLL